MNLDPRHKGVTVRRVVQNRYERNLGNPHQTSEVILQKTVDQPVLMGARIL